ncbi:hypothetical protein M0R45_031020 [Rubus argutus]|uniref:Uncharacterized protein n=1 Tax=Rubus argutus TaxID=59490 RepID=A0AAW1WG88_RUBAR
MSSRLALPNQSPSTASLASPAQAVIHLLIVDGLPHSSPASPALAPIAPDAATIQLSASLCFDGEKHQIGERRKIKRSRTKEELI